MHLRTIVWTVAVVVGLTLQAPGPASGQDGAGFVRVLPENLKWVDVRNGLGAQQAILEGDPAKPGFYVIRMKFPPGVMSRPHTHPDERHCVVLKGTWYTGEGTNTWAPAKEIGLKPGEFMRHPSGGLHYDGAHGEEVWVLISGYGPTRADVLDRGELFGRIPGAK